MSIKLLSFIGFILVLAIHRYVLSNNRFAWLGAIVPLIYIIGISVAIINSDKTLALFDYVPFILGLVLLLVFWGRGREDYNNKISKEIDSTKAKDKLN
ncbi:hypothetical protein [Staphylococcus coagulans]|uniref:hypothetical protein n=1 Tax=Staphylococcus coagulans TaxID=74706 RepID=UPI0030EEBE85